MIMSLYMIKEYLDLLSPSGNRARKGKETFRVLAV